VSRRFVAATETALAELLAADLSGLVALMIDGVHFGEHLCVVALGIGIDGTKPPKFNGVRDVRVECGAERREVQVAVDAAELLAGLDHPGGAPAQCIVVAFVAFFWYFFIAVPCLGSTWRSPNTYRKAGVRRGPPPQLPRDPGQPLSNQSTYSAVLSRRGRGCARGRVV